MSSAKGKNEKSSFGVSTSGTGDVQKTAEIKEYLEERISEMESELSKMKDMLLIVDSNLREQSFVPAIALQKTDLVSREPTVGKQAGTGGLPVRTDPKNSTAERGSPGVAQNNFDQNQSARELRRTKDSKLLANAFVDPDKVVIVPAKDIQLSQNTPPFEPFFVNRILRGFQTKDEDDSKSGKLKPDQVLRYDVQVFEGTISNVTVLHYRENTRLNEILSTITWAFTKMLEKK